MKPSQLELSRRDFMRLMGASLALAGEGCAIGEPNDRIVPYREQPPEVSPGNPRYYASSMVLGGLATGVLVASHVGRPTKVEGNPEHPSSLGATSAFEQAAILSLYDPARTMRMRDGAQPVDWLELATRLNRRMQRSDGGERLHLLLEPTSSPSILASLDELRTRHPRLGVTFYSPLTPTTRWQGAEAALGEVVDPLFNLERADVIATFDADLLGGVPGHLAYARAWARRRDPSAGAMNRLYAIETSFSETGACADHRLALAPSRVADGLASLFVALAATPALASAEAAALAEILRPHATSSVAPFIRALAADLAAAKGRSLVIVGDRQPAHAHALGWAANTLLQNLGATVTCIASPIALEGSASFDLGAFVERLASKAVDEVMILGGNPAYTAPADVPFARALAHASWSLYVGERDNETSKLTHAAAPEAHALESFGDGRAHDGTISLMQPLVRPFFDGRSVAHVLGMLRGDIRDARDQFVDAWQRRESRADFAPWLEDAQRRGLVSGSASPKRDVAFSWGGVQRLWRGRAPAGAAQGIETAFTRDARVYDGRFIHNAWLLELPAPMTNLTWGNAALVSPRTAASLDVVDGDVIRLEADGRNLDAPVLVAPGHADDSATLALGYGQQSDGAGHGVGVNAYLLRTRGAEAFVTASAKKTGDHHSLAVTQPNTDMRGREVALATSLATYRERGLGAGQESMPSFRSREPSAPAQWGMAIDLGACTGCGACVVACQAENNIPVVGKSGVLKSRQMHWLRIDRYFFGTRETPTTVLQPMLCQHCEKAPCEYVCPTTATSHSPDGINEMTYNRCVGTRFCSNNCPYKVRRFNWFNYNRDKTPLEILAKNPDVTVRARGVMEKCTFCVQRVRRAGIEERAFGRVIKDGDLMTACQQACATRAIVFGNLADESSAVARLSHSDRSYAALGDLDTQPRVRYLARVTNGNEELP